MFMIFLLINCTRKIEKEFIPNKKKNFKKYTKRIYFAGPLNFPKKVNFRQRDFDFAGGDSRNPEVREREEIR